MIVQIKGLLGISVIKVNIWGDGQTSHHTDFPAGCFAVLCNLPDALINFIPPAIPKRLFVMDARRSLYTKFQVGQCNNLCRHGR
jgi:hypothetical protein